MNLPLSYIVAPANPNQEVAGSGMNAGGCYSGIGPNIGGDAPKIEDFSQSPDINPYVLQPIGWGGDSIEVGQLTADLPDALVVDYEAADFNDTCKYTGTTPAKVWTRTAVV